MSSSSSLDFAKNLSNDFRNTEKMLSYDIRKSGGTAAFLILIILGIIYLLKKLTQVCDNETETARGYQQRPVPQVLAAVDEGKQNIGLIKPVLREKPVMLAREYQQRPAPQVLAAVDEEKQKIGLIRPVLREKPAMLARENQQRPAPQVLAAVDEEKQKIGLIKPVLREKPAILAREYQQRPAPQVLEEVDEEKQKIEGLIELVLQENPARFSSGLLEIFTSNYSTKLGEGGYGAVYKGHFSDGRPLAVKVLNNYGTDKMIGEQFMAEVNTIGRTYHRNLVRLYGFCCEVKTKALVFEYMENGSLDKLLFEMKYEIEWEKLHEIAVGAARGLEYLHHFSLRKIIHYDIKPANILLDSNFCPKIADFGLAKLCSRDCTKVAMSRGRGTLGYAAPEAWMPFPVSEKCDVYSFGIMLFEIVGRRRHFDKKSEEWFPKQVWEKFDKGELKEIWVNCEIEEKDREKAKTMVTVALWCVQYLAEARPSMRDVVKILEGGAKITNPPNPFQHLISSANVPPCIVSSSNSTTDYDEDGRDDTTIM